MSREDFKRIPQTTAQRLAQALPFPGNAATYEFGRNNLSLGSAFFQRGYYDQAEASFQRALRRRSIERGGSVRPRQRLL